MPDCHFSPAEMSNSLEDARFVFQSVLVKSILSNDLHTIKHCFPSNSDISEPLSFSPRYHLTRDYPTPTHPNLLIYSIIHERNSIVHYFLTTLHPDLSIRIEGRTALHYSAILIDHHPLAYLLDIPWIQQHIDDAVEFSNFLTLPGRGTTALHLAISHLRLANVFLLLNPSRPGFLNAEQRSAHGFPPLFLGIKTRSFKMVQILLAAGADPLIRDGTGQTALEFAKSKPIPFAKSDAGKIVALLESNDWGFDFDELKGKYAPELFEQDPVKLAEDEEIGDADLEALIATVNYFKARIEAIEESHVEEELLRDLNVGLIRGLTILRMLIPTEG
jgi:hypothetical protein